MRWARHVAPLEEKGNAYRVLVGKPEGNRPVERPRRRRENNIEICLREIGWGGVDWFHLSQDRVFCEHGNEPPGSIRWWEILT
jgi:hypothetical protein